LREPRGVVNIFIPGQPAIDRLPQQVGQRQLDILAPPGIAHVAVHEFAQAKTFVQLAHQNQTELELEVKMEIPANARRTIVRGDNNIGLLGVFLLAVAASVVLNNVARADPPQNRQQLKQLSGLPSNPKKWVCQDSLPASQAEIDAWCASHPDRGMPLPDDLRNPPPVSDFNNYLDYSNRLKNFLTGQSYQGLGWVSDAHWRLSGLCVANY